MAARRGKGDGGRGRGGGGRGPRERDGGVGEQPRARGEVRTALIRGNTFAARAVQYVEVDGLAIFEGDIVLGTVEQVARLSDMLRAESASGVASAVAITGAQFRWPDCRVPYTIDATLPDQARVTDAIAHWEANTSYRFVVRTTEPDYVTFQPGSGCSSSVGRRGGQQFVNLGAACSAGNAIHEIGHVIGLWHEQSREDRDLFVAINWPKILPGMEHNFDQHITDGDDIGAYDFGSIMHYPTNAFSVDGTDTIAPIVTVPSGVTIGQRTALSPGDIAAANSLCTPKAKEAPFDTLKEIKKEILKEVVFDTRKEIIKDIWLDTRKEIILDTLKEQIRDTLKEQPFDTIKEGAFDPGPTIAEQVVTPGQPPVVQPGPIAPFGGGIAPFTVVTAHAASPAGAGGVRARGGAGAEVGAGGLQDNIAQLDAQLQQLADQLAQAESTRAWLQEQYNETTALLRHLVQQHGQGGGAGRP
jgi:hypothetical protein